MAIELLALRCPSEEEVVPLRDACDMMEAGLQSDDLESWARADESFHFSLGQLCGNERLASMVMSMWEQSHRARMFTLKLRVKPIESTCEHQAAVEAILEGDAPKAREMYRMHRETAAKHMIAIIEQSGLTRL